MIRVACQVAVCHACLTFESPLMSHTFLYTVVTESLNLSRPPKSVTLCFNGTYSKQSIRAMKNFKAFLIDHQMSSSSRHSRSKKLHFV